MLLNCPECGLQISDKAMSCPHCGYPVVQIKKQRKPYGRHRRLPNGFGRITKISNQNLRNPYRAMVTVGKTSTGKPISKILKPKGYFRTYNEAYAALVEYNKNPFDLSSNMTLEELYKIWSESHFKKYPSKSTRNSVQSAWRYCHAIKHYKITDLRIKDIKLCLENGTYDGHTPPVSMKNKIKSLFNTMLDFAVEYELIDRNCSRQFNLYDEEPEQRKNHMSFSKEELAILWSSLDVQYVDVLLIQCYGGWRPQELGLIRLENVDLEKNIIIGGIKTKAGKDRTVPIHSKIRPLVEMKYQNAKILGSEYLINCVDDKSKDSMMMTYDKYRLRFFDIIKQLGLDPEHKPHDGRKTFITMAKNSDVNEYAIKYIVGHSINDVTEKIYTERNPNWIHEEIEKII